MKPSAGRPTSVEGGEPDFRRSARQITEGRRGEFSGAWELRAQSPPVRPEILHSPCVAS